MATGGPLPFLEFCGVEVANAARTLGYLRNGFGGSAGHWELGGGDLCGVLYRTLGGTCFVPRAFPSPSVEPAPWYDVAEPGAATFLGLLLLDITGIEDSTWGRVVQPKITGLDGGRFSAPHRGPRPVGFRGALISSDDAGAEYGYRWLASVLQTAQCDTCETCEMTLRRACPPSDCTDDTLGEWFLYDVALTDGPKIKEAWGPVKMRPDNDMMGGCRDWVTVEFTLTAGNPFLYKRPVEALLGETIGQIFTCG